MAIYFCAILVFFTSFKSYAFIHTLIILDLILNHFTTFGVINKRTRADKTCLRPFINSKVVTLGLEKRVLLGLGDFVSQFGLLHENRLLWRSRR